jgi:hypothetical protein
MSPAGWVILTKPDGTDTWLRASSVVGVAESSQVSGGTVVFVAGGGGVNVVESVEDVLEWVSGEQVGA